MSLYGLADAISGAPYRANAPVLLENFVMTGEPKIYEKIGSRGARIATAFCGECGSALYSARAEGATYLNLRLGAVRQRADLAPRRQGFCASALPWAMDITGVPKIPQ